MSARAKLYRHPLEMLFNNKRGFDPVAGMNWLQERGLISDNAVTIEDVAHEDGLRVFYMAYPLNKPKTTNQ